MLTHPRHALVGACAAVHAVVRVVEAGDVIVEELVDGLLRIPGQQHDGRIPVDQHVAEVENHVADRLAVGRGGSLRHQHVMFHIRFARPTLHDASIHMNDSNERFRGARPRTSMVPCHRDDAANHPPHRCIPACNYKRRV